MTGMSLKQYHRFRFLRLVEAYRQAQANLHSEEGRATFLVLSVQLHAAKANVPKSMWRLAR